MDYRVIFDAFSSENSGVSLVYQTLKVLPKSVRVFFRPNMRGRTLSFGVLFLRLIFIGIVICGFDAGTNK